MKTLYAYLRTHLSQDFRWPYYATVLVLLALCILFNYWLFPYHVLPLLKETFFVKSFEAYMVMKLRETRWLLALGYMAFYGLPYLLTMLLHAAFHGDWAHLHNRKWWLRVGTAIALISFDAAFKLYHFIHLPTATPADAYWVRRVLGNLSSIAMIGVPALLLWAIFDRKRAQFLYGLHWRGFHWRPYALLMAGMAVLVTAASFLSHFTSYYPTVKPHVLRELTLLPPTAGLWAYEAAYTLDFVWTEVAFRGVMVIGIGLVAGRAAIMPMVTVYCLRHFAKPLGETVSSIFGGFLLGIFALNSRNILGGVWLHMGIALLMDLTAMAQLMLHSS
jgi:hypothetical protein